jgi:hypothetical protein
MYKVSEFQSDSGVKHASIIRVADFAAIPTDPANTDYAQFKKAVAEGAELQDADGNVMSAEAAQAFVATLP